MHTSYGYIGLFLCVFLSIFGFYWFFVLFFVLFIFILGFLIVIYLQHRNFQLVGFLKQSSVNPLEERRSLGLNLALDKPKNPMVLASKIKIQTETPKHKNKKSIIDSGIELLRKHAKNIKDGHKEISVDLRNSVDLDTVRDDHLLERDKKWNPFETIKVYSEKRKSMDKTARDSENVSFGVECTFQSAAAPLTPIQVVDSPKKRKIMTNNQQIDTLLHTIIDYILRDFIESWFKHVSTDLNFSETVRTQMENFLINICQRVKNCQILSLMTTKLIDDMAQHAKLFRMATEATKNVDAKKEKPPDRLSPQRTDSFHRRNKSETDVSWNLGNAATQKNVANSRFYGVQTDEKCLMDPEQRFLNAFFDEAGAFREESLDERKLETYLTHVMETIMYFSLPPTEFDCLPLRSFLCTLLANVVIKPLINMLSDPDFINLQIARYAKDQPPAGEFLIKMIRQCTDLSELRAVRQFITKEMDAKHQDPAAVAELASLKYTQKLIDLRISNLQNNRNENIKVEKEKFTSNLPILTIDEILTKELALSYYLDYLSILNLQKYVIFYLTAQEWKLTTSKSIADLQMKQTKESKDELMKNIRDKAYQLYKEYLTPSSANYLNVDLGLIEALNYKLKDTTTTVVENTWFDSISKFIYEKLKNDDIFLSNFYQSSAYKKLLLELDVLGQQSEHDSDIDLNLASMVSGANNETESEGSSDVLLDDDDDEGDEDEVLSVQVDQIKEEYGITITRQSPESINIPLQQHSGVALSPAHAQLCAATDGVAFKHMRSHSDCTGLIPGGVEIRRSPLEVQPPPQTVVPTTSTCPDISSSAGMRVRASLPTADAQIEYKQKLSAKIINTAIHSDGQYAVYAIQVNVIEENKHKSWHIYRRYSKFLELKKYLIKRFPFLKKVPFPAKKAFQNTQRAVLEHRMTVLNEFLAEICEQSERNDEMNMIMREFLEPDTDDRKMHGGAVIRTIESLVHPFKSGMRTIKNMPDTLVGGLSRILLGKGQMKEQTFLNYTSVQLEQSSDYPALTSALHLLDEVFDLQARSQWLRRGLINRLLGAPWVSYTANKKIIHAAKNLIEMDKLETILLAVLNNVWPDGKRQNKQALREDNTKMRTRMAAKLVLFALLSDDLKHLVGSETTRIGLLNFFTMLQNKKLNIRLILVLLNDILNVIYNTNSMVKHVA